MNSSSCSRVVLETGLVNSVISIWEAEMESVFRTVAVMSDTQGVATYLVEVVPITTPA